MLDRKRQRVVENFTYFFGGLTEEEQSYRDYYQTDIEEDPEDDYVEGQIDNHEIASGGQLDPKLYDFIESSLRWEVHENFDDLVADKVFKYKYKQYADQPEVFARRMNRVASKFIERARKRDPRVESSLVDLYQRDDKDNSVAQIMMNEQGFQPTG